MDGAHTHRHGPGSAGIGTALLIGAALAVIAQAVNAAAAIVHALLIGLACSVVLALAALIAYAVTVCRRHHRAGQAIPGPLPPEPGYVPLAGDREVVSLRQAITELHAQLTAARAARGPAELPEAHQHLHFHGLDPDQVAAILAAYRREAGDGE
jgi:hypothetical protein